MWGGNGGSGTEGRNCFKFVFILTEEWVVTALESTVAKWTLLFSRESKVVLELCISAGGEDEGGRVFDFFFLSC